MAAFGALTKVLAFGAGLTAISCPGGIVTKGNTPRPAPAASRVAEAPPEAAAAQPVSLKPKVDLSDQGEWPEPDAEGGAHVDATTSVDFDPERAVTAIRKETFVFARPDWRSKKLGYLRAGTVATRRAEPSGFKACEQGWYRIEPRGYVCVGKTASLDAHHPTSVAARVMPRRDRPLPYSYAIARFPTPPLYAKVPTPAEQRRVERGLRKHRARVPAGLEDVDIQPIPSFLVNQPAPTLNGYVHSKQSVYTGRARVQSGYAFLRFFESEGRRFGLSTDMEVLPLDRLKPIVKSDFKGIELDETIKLPVAFSWVRGAHLMSGDKQTGLKADRRLSFREALPLSGERIRIGSAKYLAVTGGGWVRADHVVHVPAMKRRPGWAKPGRTWIDISILRQTLVAYEGVRPVYATLVSTGAAGLGDPEETHSTVRGRFLIHTKHVTATMSGDEDGDNFELKDVPYVQYFTEGYALHAAYWHNSFGKPRSHGCINLSPADAQWLFGWTDPPVPADWHGAMSLREGTLVSIHP